MNAAPIIRKALIAAGLAPVFTIIFAAAVTAAFAIPNGPIVRHILERPGLVEAKRADNGRVIDADTECIGLSVGLFESETAPKGLFRRAMNAESLHGCDAFIDWLETGETDAYRNYFRYWHGYTILTRSALALLPYNDLRGHIFTISIVLTGILAWRLGRDFGALFALSFLLPFLVLNAHGFWVVATKAVTWYLIIGGSLYFTRRKSEAPPLLAFFTLGALTAFFDYFTTPVLVFVLPAMIHVMYAQRRSGREGLWTHLLAIGAFFVAGYAGLWIIKFVIASSVLDAPVWKDVVGAALYRLRGASPHVESFIPGAAILENIESLKVFWWPIALALFVLAPVAMKASRLRLKNLWRSERALVALAATPLLWLEIVSNHSQYHAAFTQLNFAPAFFLAALALTGASDRLAGRVAEAPIGS